MKKTSLSSPLAIAATAMMIGTVATSQPLSPPKPAKAQRIEAPVLKIFSANDGDHKFVAYLVSWKGAEVIVSDPLAKSEYKPGDTITFLASRTDSPRYAALSFTLFPGRARGNADSGDGAMPKEEQDRQMRIVSGDLDAAKTETERFYALGRAARNALDAGKIDEAKALSLELEALAAKHKDDWNYGNAVQDSNQVFGRIALSAGDVEEAKRRLLASADSKGSPQMNSFGPNMQLAKELLEKGEKDVVMEYFDRCGDFWEMGTDSLDQWRDSVSRGTTPNFGANLKY
ncbi:hypothetical protein Pla175_46570 [Pirellulimonas nuda]|uniref:Tetratricopeptide repeat protein n=1 Tax=Pirellulimonas nuda TaxID=2528009 RepID=A0A518DID1_9BACT|nr:hypothetical protein [Pirellulimonas nuda]QDU91237.1 hypothetical protein Pla175_46570 [Pirellulimonas nuda]